MKNNIFTSNKTDELLNGTSFNWPYLMPFKIAYNSNINKGCMNSIDIGTHGFRCDRKVLLLY